MPFHSKKQQVFLRQRGAWIPVEWVFGTKSDHSHHHPVIHRVIGEIEYEAFPPTEEEVRERFGVDYL